MALELDRVRALCFDVDGTIADTDEVGAQTTRPMKPHPKPLFFAASAMGVDLAQCLMIGDTTIDIRTGVSAGAQTVGVLCGFGTGGELRRAGPT